MSTKLEAKVDRIMESLRKDHDEFIQATTKANKIISSVESTCERAEATLKRFNEMMKLRMEQRQREVDRNGLTFYKPLILLTYEFSKISDTYR